MSFGIPVRNGLGVGLLASTFLSSRRAAYPAMSLDFLQPFLDSRITFTRGSNATLVDTTGAITYAPANLLTYSQDFDNAAWTKTRISVSPNTTTAPDNTTTADTFTGAGGGTTCISQVMYATGGTHIASIYAKAGTKSVIQFSANSFAWGVDARANFDLANGVLGTVDVGLTATITAAGNGWYRCSVSAAKAATAGAFLWCIVDNTTAVREAAATAGTIFAWGAQLEPVSYQTTPRTYVATAASAYYGPRFDYNPVTLAPRGLLIEEARTNLFLNSLISGASLSTQSVTVTAVPHTISFYGTGTITLSGAATATVVGTGVYPNRQTLTFTPIVGVLICTVTGSVQYAQIENGGFATSFIPTAALPVPRNADVATMTGTNFSSWYNQTEGTFVINADVSNNAGFSFVGVSAHTPGGTNNNRVLDITSGIARTYVYASGTLTGAMLNLGSVTINTPFKQAFAYNVSTNNGVLNAAAVQTAAVSPAPAAITVLGIGVRQDGTVYSAGHIRQIAYYNTRLPDVQLQSLTV